MRGRAASGCGRIALTERRGAACVPVAADVARFWISRLHGPGPGANDWAVLRCLGIAAQKLNDGDEAGAQKALDASELTRLSSDGVVLMRVVAGSLGIGPLDLPWADGPRLWRAEDIAAHLPLFKDYAPAANLLAKAGAWDESKHPRAPAGSREGGQFQSGGGGDGGRARRHRASAMMPGRRSTSRQKFRRWTRLPSRCAMRLQSLPRDGWRASWRAPLLDLRESLSSHWKRRRKPPRGFTTNIHLSKPISISQSRSESFKIMLESPAKDTMFTILWSRLRTTARVTLKRISMGRTISSRIPRLKHWEITGWYMRGNKRFGGLSPREYLRGKDWDERRQVGLEALIEAGVLEP
ncbi:MAG TPA: hypothetical protein VGP28_11885 [Methylocella sp.]|nr:hypothetical protein [Methylocella sp.]